MRHDLYVLAARRTPIGAFLGSLKSFSAIQLGTLVASKALEDAQVNGSEIVHSIFGNVCTFSSPEGIYLSRHIALKSGVQASAGSLTVNRLCGSGFEAIAQASQWISQGPCLVGGAENMSAAPLMLRGTREGWKFAQPPKTIDSLFESLTDNYAQMSMGETAELLAKEYSITREDCDRWAYLSHSRATQAEAKGLFKSEMTQIPLPTGENLDRDEHIRRDSSIEKLAKLKPVFGGVTTAGNASGMNDAAAALILCDAEYLKQWMSKTKRKPLCRIIASKAVGCDPKRMGLGPVFAMKKLLAELNWELSTVDYLEINEAFAAQILAVKKELSLSDEQLNPHGSGISLGHPLGATGARISTHIAHLMMANSNGLNMKRAIGGACIGGGQGMAIAFEAIKQ